MENDLYKIRSIGGCIKAAYELYSSNIKHIIRRTWLPALLLAVFSAAALLATAKLTGTLGIAAAHTVKVSTVVIAAIAITALSLLAYAAYTWLYAIIVSLLNGESMKRNLPRIIRLMALTLCIAIVLGLIIIVVSLIPISYANNAQAYAAASRTSSIIIGLTVLVFAVAALPLYFSMMKYAMETDSKLFSVFKKPYIVGWTHWGYLFLVALLTGIITMIIDIVASLPLTVTAVSFQMNIYGQAMGDPSGLPGYFFVLYFLAAMVAAFIMAYVCVWLAIVVYYAYGHIEAKEKSKRDIVTEVAEEATTEAQTRKAVPEPDFEEVK